MKFQEEDEEEGAAHSLRIYTDPLSTARDRVYRALQIVCGKGGSLAPPNSFFSALSGGLELHSLADCHYARVCFFCWYYVGWYHQTGSVYKVPLPTVSILKLDGFD